MTRSEISARINALTRDKSNRNSELRSYQSSLNCAKNLASKLNNGLSYLNIRIILEIIYFLFTIQNH